MPSVKMSEIAVIGSGPAAMLCALAAARRNWRVHLYVQEPNSKVGAAIESVEAAPAAIIALLIEFGVSPAELGVFGANSTRQIAWEHERPVAVEHAPAIHIERPALERALLAQILRCNRIAIEPILPRTFAWNSVQWNIGTYEARYLIDATGRRAITARRRIAPIRRWFARLWQFPRTESEGKIYPLAIANLPGGYAYRIASRRLVTFGAVGPSLGKVQHFDDLRANLDQWSAGWIALGLGNPLSQLGSSTNSSVQWPADPDCGSRNLVRIGDAALAREPLASQGISGALCDALYAVTAIGRGQLDLLEARQREQRSRHVESLRRIIADGVHHDSPEWSEYCRWLDGQSFLPEAPVALRDGHLRIIKSI